MVEPLTLPKWPVHVQIQYSLTLDSQPFFEALEDSFECKRIVPSDIIAQCEKKVEMVWHDHVREHPPYTVCFSVFNGFHHFVGDLGMLQMPNGFDMIQPRFHLKKYLGASGFSVGDSQGYISSPPQ